jgi:AraC-like DNA-binding protein
MLTRDTALSEVALACGFTDQSHLSRLFRRCTGQSPAAWRRERREAVKTAPPVPGWHPADERRLHGASLIQQEFRQ